MNKKTLSGRRKVFPVESKACRVPGYYLNFDCEGILYAEPCFASIGNSPWIGSPNSPELQGVAHLISRTDFERIQRTEGGGGHPGLGYQPAKVPVECYDGTKIETITLIHTISIKQFRAHPSLRYKKIILDGAIDYGLDAEYVRYLESIPSYERPKTYWFYLSFVLFVVPFLALAGLPAITTYAICRLTAGQGKTPRVSHEILSYFLKACYVMHHKLWKHLCGEGYMSSNVLNSRKIAR